MASRIGQHLLRAKFNAVNFGLFALYLQLFFYQLFDCTMGNLWLLLSKQSHSINVNHCMWAISFWPGAGLGGVRSLHLTECLVSFDHNVITPQMAKNALSRLKPCFSKMQKCPQYPKQVHIDIAVALRLAKYLIGCKIQGSKLQLFADKSMTYNAWFNSYFKLGQCPKYTKRCIIQLTVSLQA